MKKRKSFILIPFLALIVIIVVFTGSKPNEPVMWYKFSEGLNKSSELEKKTLVYVYTDWCGWCKKMESQTFYNKNVSNYLKENFVSVKMNAESSVRHTFMDKSFSEREITREFGITGYPAVIFFDEKNEPITVLPGYVDAENFIHILEYISDNHYKSIQFDDFIKGRIE